MVVQYARNHATFMQGNPRSHVMYIQAGGVKLSVVSKTCREAMVALRTGGRTCRGDVSHGIGACGTLPR
jgi:hypothetical protein